MVFQTMLPTIGSGALRNREDPKLINTDKESQLYEPADFFWRKISNELAQMGVTVDMFVFPGSYIDIGSIGNVATVTGGNIFMYAGYQQPRDGAKFVNDLYRSQIRVSGYDALLRVRCSNGTKFQFFIELQA